MRRGSVLTRGSIWPRRGNSAAYRDTCSFEDTGVFGEDPEDVRQHERGLDLEDQLVGVGRRVNVALLLGCDHLGPQATVPAADVGGDPVAQGAGTRVELRHGGDEEAAAGKYRALHVGDEVLAVGV